MVEYEYSRLCFKADVIEPLKDDESFIIHTSNGTFMFTKSDFYQVFSNVIASESYKNKGLYSYTNPPKKAMRFLISDQNSRNNSNEKMVKAEDLVGDDIRQKIKEIGILWHNSPNNPSIDGDVLRSWNNLIDEWIEDVSMPLIIRKNTDKRGQSFKHSSNREIIISDNTFAIWVFSNVLKGKVFTLAEIKEMLKHNELPIVFMATKDIKKKAKYTKSLGRYSLAGWKLCHIQPVGFNTSTRIEDLDISKITEHFRKYANPNNMFVLPKEIGDLGEIDVFIEEQKR